MIALLLASALSITSNTAVVKGWYREHLMYEPSSGTFSRPEFPTEAEARGASLVAQSIPRLLDESLEALSTNLAPVAARLEEQRARPVVLLAGDAEPENAIGRQNLTMVVVSNEIVRAGSNVTVHAWVFGNSVLASPPVVRARMATDLGRAVAWRDCSWSGYGDETAKSVVTVRGETYEAYRLSFTFGGVPTNLAVRLRPWVKIGDPATGFNYGNRQLRVNNVLCCTTNSLAFLGVFSTTNGVAITDLVPYADRGELRFAEPEDETEE